MLSDWLAPGVADFDVPFMNALCLYQAVSYAAFFAGELHFSEEKAAFTAQKRLVQNRINRKWFDKENVKYAKGIQGENVLPLLTGCVPERYRERLAENVKKHYCSNGFRFDTGIVLTPLLIDCLCQNGMSEITFRLLTAKGFPSYSYMLDGESTFPEHWSKKWPDYRTGKGDEIVRGGDLSHCHPMFASVISRLFRYAVGMDFSMLYRGKVLVEPRFLKEMTFAEAEKQTQFGRVFVKWKRTGNEVFLTVGLPSGLKGIVRVHAVSDLSINGKSRRLGGNIVVSGKTAIRFKTES